MGHTHDHDHVTHHHKGGVLDEFEHRAYWHTHRAYRPTRFPAFRGESSRQALYNRASLSTQV